MSSDRSETGPGSRTRAKTREEERKRQRARGEDSSSSDDGSESDEAAGGIDMEEYRKFLGQLFPSKYMDDKVEASDAKPSKKKKKTKAKRKKRDRETESEEEEEEEEEASGSESSGSEMDSDEEAELAAALGGARFNIVFTMGGGESDDSEAEWEDDEDDEEEDVEEEEEEDEAPKKKKSKKLARGRTQSPKKESAAESPAPVDESKEREVIDKLKGMFEGLSKEERSSKVVQDLIAEYESIQREREVTLKKRQKKERARNTGQFKKLLREKNVMNDVRFFKEKLEPGEQKLVLQQMQEVREHCDVVKPYRLTLLDAKIPLEYKSCAYKKICTLKYMEPGGGEYFKIKTWVDTFMRIPFGVHRSLPLRIEDGVEKCHAFMDQAKQTLDKAVYGLDDAKLQIMQMVGQWITNPSAVGTAIAIKGPMGTGKTTLVKEGISKILGREFAFLALGGATDSSFLEGHSYTYEGSTWGKVVDILLQSRSMNPVIYFDELDKVSETPKGEEITGILTHLTDTSQNSKFHDKYFAEIDFDLSRCLFIFSYNDESRVNPILRDRMYRIQTKGYDEKEKLIIARDYLLPKIREQVKFGEGEVVIPEETMRHVIKTHTAGEQGVRNLKRCLEIVHTKLNLYRLMKPGSNLFQKDMDLEVSFPFTVTSDVVDKLIRVEKRTGAWQSMYM